MSATVPTQEVDCGYCEEKYNNGTGIKGSFCSQECWHQSKGENIRRQINNDHRFCSSCYRRQKSIEKPPEWFLKKRPQAIQDSIVGFEYYTEHVHKEGGFAFCECGNVGHFHEHEFLRDLEFNTAVKNLAVLLVTYYKEGQIKQKPDVRKLANTLQETNNLNLAVGAAII